MDEFASLHENLLHRQDSNNPPQIQISVYDGHDGLKRNSEFTNVPDVDDFFRQIYLYFHGKGMFNICLKNIIDLTKVLFTFLVLWFLTVGISYAELRARLRQPCLSSTNASVTVGSYSLFEKDCRDNLPFSFERMNRLGDLGIFLVVIFSITWFFFLGKFLFKIPALIKMKKFFTKELNIDFKKLQTLPWDEVMERVVHQQNTCHIYKNELCALDITNIITRYTDYFVAVYREDFMKNGALNVDFLPSSIGKNFLPLSLEWTFEMLVRYQLFSGPPNRSHNMVRESIFDDNNSSRLKVAKALRNGFRLLGILHLAVAPIMLVLRLALLCFEYAGELRESKGRLGSRQWSPYARWYCRHYCEVDHEFEKRLKTALPSANRYCNMFQLKTTALLAKFLCFVFGALFGILFVFTFVFDDDFALADLSDNRSVTWWLGIFGGLYVLADKFSPDESITFEPTAEFDNMRKVLPNIPKIWSREAYNADVLGEVQSLFTSTSVFFAQEILGVILTPYLLCFRLPAKSDDIVNFFFRNTHRINKGLGDVCSFAVLGKHDADVSLDASVRVNKRHMEDSLLNFQINHPKFVQREPSR